MEAAILDTDILNEVLKPKNQQVVAAASTYLRLHGQFAMSALTRYGSHPRSDADLIIAATAFEHDRTLVTGNTPHFSWISGLSLANWRDS